MITIELAVTIGTLISLLLGFLIAVIRLGQSFTLEKYYRKVVIEVIDKPGFLPKAITEVPSEIIVDTKSRLSPLRIFLKKKITQIRRRKVPPVILIFGDYSEEEQKAFLIEKALASSLMSQLLDLDFLESLILYFAYRYVYESNEIEPEVVTTIRKDFEKSKYRDWVVTLDSLEFSTNTILNPPPEEQPLLRNIILPMIREKEKNLLQIRVDLSIIEKWKSFFMTLIRDLYSKKCSVILIGVRSPQEYLEMLDKALQEFDRVILCARGKYIQLMNNIIEKRFSLEESKPLEEQVITTCGREDITGWWEFPGEKVVRCKWVIFSREKTS